MPPAAALFDLLWESLADVLGTAATATLLRRAIKAVASKTSWSESVTVARNGLDYEYHLPETWKKPDHEEALNALRIVAAELRVLLVELREHGDIVLRVRDTGMGIAPEMLPRVFDLFAQSDRLPADRPGGLGVGLTLARTLTELHGGTITVESEGPGRGSQFVVRLPVGAPMAFDRDDRRQPPVQVRHILLVDDDDNVRKALRRMLELDGHRVETARDGPEGVGLALATAPEVAFIDIGLPGIDGYEVARCIRAALGSRVLLVAFTAYGQERDRRRSIAAGFDAHLVKPASDEDLTRVLGRAAGGDA